MADTWYAWSNFPAAGKTVGDAISQADLEGVDDDEWAYLVETGVVRKDHYPKIASSKSPTEHMKEQIARAEGNTDTYVAEDEPAPAKQEASK